MSWGSFPVEWVTNGGVKEFASARGVMGRSIAALKVALAVASYRDFKTGEVVLSANDLVNITGTSKPMVFEGVTILTAMRWIETETRGAANVNRYTIAVPNLYRKVPQDTVCDNLGVIGLRHVRSLDALKLYLCMLYSADKETYCATVSHKTLVELSGVRPEGIAAANSILAAAHFVHIRPSAEWTSAAGHPTNEYRLLGDFAGRRARRPRPSAARGLPAVRPGAP